MRHSGPIGVCLSLASPFWGSRRRGFVAAVLPEAWLGWFTGGVGTCAGDTPRAAWWGPKQPHCCCLHIWSLDWVALPSASLSPFFSLHIHPSILSPSAARRSPQLTLALPNPNLIHCLRSCRLSAETQDRLSLFPVSHSLSFTLFSLSSSSSSLPLNL